VTSPDGNTSDGNTSDGDTPDGDTSDGDTSDGDTSDGGDRPRTLHVFSNEGSTTRLDHLITEHLPQYTRAYLQRLIQSGHVSLEPSRARKPKAATKVGTGVVVRVVVPPPLRVSLAPEALPLEFLYEDEHIAVINKPAGLSVHPAPQQLGPTLVNALMYWIDDLSGIAGVERPGIVHRLDRETTGVIVVAKNDLAHQELSRQFRQREVHKTYLAIARGKPRNDEGRLSFPLGRSRTHSKKQVVRDDGQGRAALTDYRILETFEGYCLVECYPTTGRTHQIRVHLGAIHLPIACDKLYGREREIHLCDLARKKRPAGSQAILDRHALHAASISFRHPVEREDVCFSAPVPDDMLEVLHALHRYRSPR